jgi:hypothetical protein
MTGPHIQVLYVVWIQRGFDQLEAGRQLDLHSTPLAAQEGENDCQLVGVDMAATLKTPVHGHYSGV